MTLHTWRIITKFSIHIDIMLFPAYWIRDGTAGACVEVRIVGVTIIASNHKYNKKLL